MLISILAEKLQLFARPRGVEPILKAIAQDFLGPFWDRPFRAWASRDLEGALLLVSIIRLTVITLTLVKPRLDQFVMAFALLIHEAHSKAQICI